MARQSHGDFKIESVLRFFNASGELENLFALGVGVLAGNMYVSRDLVQKPSYLYQIAASDHEYVIYRTDTIPGSPVRKLIAGRTETRDSIDLNQESFDSINIHIELEPALSVGSYSEIEGQYHHRAHFSCILGFLLPGERKMELEFPIKHINLLPNREMFQVETGPILFSDPEKISSIKSEQVKSLIPSFAHFNRLDHADITIDYPYGVRETKNRGDLGVKSLDCEILLLVNRS